MGYVGEEGNGYKHFYDKHSFKKSFSVWKFLSEMIENPNAYHQRKRCLTREYIELHTITMTGAVWKWAFSIVFLIYHLSALGLQRSLLSLHFCTPVPLFQEFVGLGLTSNWVWDYPLVVIILSVCVRPFIIIKDHEGFMCFQGKMNFWWELKEDHGTHPQHYRKLTHF